ncbi:SDR family NAD(P)-dependent oxidoreductase [Mobilicoccus pelagius]|uniref:Putative oxidoreductase n=1 Tax=Mobilicoccus pelagius NBRC 104925 TaxID=1089455 RepID=H5URG6_9MICO|nr:SDR family NAD(P)-dependent oxidoreductase [Mobilicoccus pelagius]GAB48324.1 putative oxidoreductase [Mobilicoccus pelagius NBRC 104925]
MSTSTVDLSGKVVLVAGAAGAAGPPTLARLVEAGATVVAIDNDASRLDPVVATANETQGEGRAQGVVVDLLEEGATKPALTAVREEQGRIDGLLHLVGGWRGGKGIVESDLADWELMQNLLVRTLQHTSRACHDALVESGGRLAIISTPQAQTPGAKNASYAAAKAAAETWTLAVADSFAAAAKAAAEEGRDAEDAAAVIVQIKALLTDAMKEERPDRKFPGYSHVDDVAAELVGLFALPAADLNGTRRSLAP